MGMFRVMGLFAVIPTAILLTASFFVLVTLRKVETQGLKVFGYVSCVLLWLGALLIFASGAYTLSTGRPACPMMKMMQGKMHGQKQMMMKDKGSMMMPGMMQGQMDTSKAK